MITTHVYPVRRRLFLKQNFDKNEETTGVIKNPLTLGQKDLELGHRNDAGMARQKRQEHDHLLNLQLRRSDLRFNRRTRSLRPCNREARHHER